MKADELKTLCDLHAVIAKGKTAELAARLVEFECAPETAPETTEKPAIAPPESNALVGLPVVSVQGVDITNQLLCADVAVDTALAPVKVARPKDTDFFLLIFIDFLLFFIDFCCYLQYFVGVMAILLGSGAPKVNFCCYLLHFRGDVGPPNPT